jgi:uncharacterized protein
MFSKRFSIPFFNLILILTLAFSGLTALPETAFAAGTISLSLLGTVYTENFDTLASTGTSSTVPVGWDFVESGTNANALYTAGTGSNNAGDTYSFGASGSSERAFGGLLSGSLVPTIGASFTNDTGSIITSLDITYTGEQWRLGTLGREDRLDFQYSTDAASLTTGTWIDFNDLDFIAPATTGTSGALDGNSAANRTTLNSVISGLNITNGSTFWIRWMDFNASSSDDGLAVDDFSLRPNAEIVLSTPLINEFVFNHVGTDTHEYVEIYGDSNSDYSAFTILQIEGDGLGTGVIDSIQTVGTTNANGFWVTGFLSNVFENGTVTLLLVEDFSGTVGLDLDDDNDGVLNATPWARVVDDVAVTDGGAGDKVYASTVLAPGFSGNPFTPGSASRILNGVDTDSAGDWIINDFDGAGLPGFVGTIMRGEAVNTPGRANVVASGSTTLVINEIDYDQPSTDTAEFIEIKNVSGTAINLSGYEIILVNGTGGGATVYETIPFPNVSLDENSYYVVCGNAATVDNCDLDVSPDTNLIQNGAPDAVALVFNGEIVDTVSYEGNTGAPYTEGSGVGLEDPGGTENANLSISRFPDGLDTNQNNADFRLSCITPGEPNTEDNTNCVLPPSDEVCGDPFTPIYAVQGSGLVSQLAGLGVATEGIVVGDFQNNSEPDQGDLNGFYIQDLMGDGNPATSDGIFVYAPGSMDLSEGDLVRVRGTVAEFNGSTQITSVSTSLLCSRDNLLPAATVVDLPVSSLDDFERFEGMLVTFPQVLYISEYFNFDRFGEIVLTTERHFQPTAIFEPGSADAANLATANTLSRITLDDGRSSQNPDPAIHPNGSVFDLDNLFRGGDTVQNVTGVMDFSFGLYRIHPTNGADYVPANPRTDQPDDVGGDLKIASFNVLNYFTTIDTGAPICGPAGNQECRGADTSDEFTRQRAKIIAALETMDADVVGLIEIENYPGDVPTADLVSGLNDMLGAGSYDFISTGAIGSDAIRVAIIYKPGKVTPFGSYAVLDSSVDSRFLDTYNRPVLAQTFQDNSTGGIVTVAVNHLKSKGSSCSDIGDPDIGDGQGNCNLTRKAAAEALVDWLATDPTHSGNKDYLIIGDLNSYDKEDPIDAILAGGYTDLVLKYQGEYAYSYVFDGQLGYLDHALSSPSLTVRVTGATVWHINADEPDLIDYDTTFKQPAQAAIFYPDAYRSSDHDPVIVGLTLNVPPTIGASPEEQFVQYSDRLEDVIITGSDMIVDIPLSISTQWKVGTGDFMAGLPEWLTLTNNGCTTTSSDGACTWTLSGTALTTPETYIVRATVMDLGGYSADTDITVTVNQEDALAAYTGAEFAATASTTSSTASVTLAATIQDDMDGFPGDIRNATVTFVNRDTGNAYLCSAPVGLVNPNDITTGTATCTWEVDLGNADSTDARVGIIVEGYYHRNNPADDSILTVSRALTSSFITGGGNLLLSNSNGLLAGDSGSRNSFGFNVKYNRSGRNLQGRINTLVISGGRVYQIKGNVLSSLVVDQEAGIAIFNGRASIQDVTDSDNPVDVAGNTTLQVTLTDQGEPGSSDSIAITVWNKDGGLYFSSHWDGVRTVEQFLAGGNLVVH